MTSRPWDDKEFLKKEFVENQRSTSDIAKELGTYPNTIRRALIKHGFNPRNKSQAQKINIEKNGAPMEGKTRTAREKDKISRGLQKFWDGLDDTEDKKIRQKLRENAIENWSKISKVERNKRINKMHEGNRKKARQGSKNENMVADTLSDIGFKVVQRSKDYSPGRRFEIDIALPEERYAIEWDGVTHFLPVYGEEHLQTVQQKDKQKDKQLIGSGWTIIRCRDMSTAPSLALCRRAVDSILEILSSGETKRVHIIEVK